MPYVPRDSATLVKAMLARTVARSALSDVVDGGVMHTLIKSVAEELAGVEWRLKTLRDSFSIANASGTDLDDRLAELPPEGLKRQPEVAASGAVMQIVRTSSAAVVTFPVGMIFRRLDDPTMLYRTSVAVTMGIGVDTASSVAVTCMTPGKVGNCPSGVITDIVSASADIQSVTNAAPLTNGVEEESDDQAIARALVYLSSLARCQPQALEFAALSFVAADGSQMRFAKTDEDANVAGLSRLIVDDGSGLPGMTQPGAVVTGTVPASGQRILWHEAPATAAIEEIGLVRAGAPIILKAANGDFVSIPERGLIYLASGKVIANDAWTVTGYNVYTGILSELQKMIEGDPSDPVNFPGHRAAGTRVRVIPPNIYPFQADVHVVPRAHADLTETGQLVTDAIIGYLSTLGPGQPVYIAGVIDKIMDLDDVLNVKFYVKGINPAVPLADGYPSPDQVARATETDIAVIPAP